MHGTRVVEYHACRAAYSQTWRLSVVFRLGWGGETGRIGRDGRGDAIQNKRGGQKKKS